MIHSMSAASRVNRKGFTLVELLVMSAVCVIIMAVLASVFGTGLDAIRQIRAQGDMMDQTRSASEVIKRDLRNQIFLADPVVGVGERTRLSEYRFDTGAAAPRGGFFRIYSPTSTLEGIDSDGLWSTTATGHQLHFTTIASGNADANQYSASLNAGTVTSPAAEVAYFLVSDPGRNTGSGVINGVTYGPQQTYLLIRRQRLIAVNDNEKNRIQAYVAGDPNPGEVLSLSGTTVNRLADVVNGNRMAMAQIAPGSSRYGDDILLSNVLSFEVKALMNTPGAYPGSGDTDHPYQNITGMAVQPAGGAPNPNTIDTGTTPSPNVRVRALLIRIRIYDTKLMQARQLTFVQDM